MRLPEMASTRPRSLSIRETTASYSFMWRQLLVVVLVDSRHELPTDQHCGSWTTAPIPSDLRSQRFVISERSLNALGGAGESGTFDFAFPRLSNHYFNATFISNEQDIIYNCELRKSGSPWTRSGGSNLSRAKWKTPGDRRFRGYSKRAIDNDAGGGRGLPQPHHSVLALSFWASSQ